MENKKVWFKRKKYGYGWTPVCREGWLVIIIHIILVALSTFFYFKYMNRINQALELPVSIIMLCYLLVVLFFSLVLIYIAYKKGEKPKWQWGK